MADKLNKSGNRRGMSKGSKEALNKHNFKNVPKDKLKEISAKGHEGYKTISSLTKTACEIAKEEAETEITNKKGEKIVFKRALVKKVQQMALNGNINAITLMLKLLGEMPADKVELSSTEKIQQGLDKINEYFGNNTK